MLPKKRRVSKEAFKDLRGSRTLSLSSFTLRIITTSGPSRVAFIVSKKIAKTAVERNKIRRRGYGSIEKIINNVKNGVTLIFYLKSESTPLSLKNLSKEIEKALAQGGLLKN